MPSVCFAEGSRTLYPAAYNPAGFRADLDLTGAANLYAGVTARRQFIYVYAQAGEYMLLGSSNRANGGDIVVYNPQSFGAKGNETIPGSANFSCGAATPPAGSFSGGTLGRIAARANELAGPNSADNSATVTNGYAPCSYLAPSTGIYGVLFSVATSGGSGPSGSVATLHIGNATVAAWDVTVRASATSTADTNARVFTYGLVAFTGANSRPVYHSLFYATQDGARYQQDMQGLDPNGYALWGSPSGFLDNGQPLYKDIRGNGALVNAGFPAEITAQLPQAPMFFSTIDPGGANASQAALVLQMLGIPLSPPTPQLTNPAFSGVQGGNQTYVGGGGTFTFTTQNLTSYLIVISAGSDYDPGNPANATLRGLAPDGANTVPWNGLNNGGTAFPTGTFNFRIVGRNGEIHFPIIDAEGNATGGPTVTKLNGVAGDHTVYYDDRGYVTRNNVTVGTLNGLLCPANPPVPPTPDHTLLGQDSSAKTFAGGQCNGGVGTCYYRYWPGNGNANTDCAAAAGFGDAKGLDLWTYQQTTPQILPIVINPPPPGPTVATSVSVPPTAYPGATVNGSFNFLNVGGMTATGVTYAAVIGTPGNCPTNLAFPLLPAGVTFTYDTSTCAVTFSGMPTTLTAGQSLNFNFSYTAPASGSVPVSTTINSGNGGSANAAGTTTIIVADVTTSISVPPTAPGGSPVSGTITYDNAAAATATANGITYAATIGTPGSCPANVTFPILPTGVTASYNNSSCQVTFSGLPTSLTPGQTFNIGFQYTGPNSGTVPVSSAITTTTPESNTANNTSSGATVFSSSPNVTLTKTGPATAVQGQNFDYTLDATNNGQTATAAAPIVQDQLPTNLIAQSANGANCGTLPSAAGALLTCTLPASIAGSGGTASFTLTVSALSAGAITNYAATNPVGSGNPPSPPGSGCNAATTSCASASTTVNTVADLSVTKTASPASTYVPGQSLNYTITVTNNGPSDLNGVSVTDTVPGTVTVSSWTCSTASAGADCDTTSPGTGASGTTNTITLNNVSLPADASISVAVNGTAALSATGPITNSVMATPPAGASCSMPPCARTAQVTNTNTGAPQLSIAKSATPGAFAVGQTGTYSLLVGNSGSSATVAPITVTDPLPAGITTTATPSGTGWDCSASTSTQISCTTVSVLLPGSNAPVINAPVTIAAGTASPATNTATVNGGGDGSCPSAAHCQSTIQTPVNAPLIDVIKTLSGSLIVGVPANYVITATNNGQAATLAGTITDTIPTGLTIGTLPAGCGASGQAVTCVLPAGIASGGSVSYTIPVTPQAATDGSSVSNTAIANGGGDPSCPGAGHCDGTTTNTVTAPQLQLTKTANPATFVVGQPASYTLTLTNTGTAATTALTTITDTVPTGLTLGTLPAGCTVSGQAVTCTIASGLATNSPVSFVIPVTPQAGVNGQSVVNTAGATGGGDPGCVDGTPLSGLPARCVGSVTTPVSAPQLTIVKTASAASFVVGVPASYTLQVTNTGTATTTSTSTVTDVIPGGLTIGTLPGGCTASAQQVTCTIASGLLTNSPVSFVIAVTPTAAASGTTLSNTATVSGGGDPTCPTTGNCTSTVTTPVNAPQLTIVKTASAAAFVVGVPASYTLQVTNTGTAATTAASTVTDNVPSTLTIGTLPAGCGASGQAVTCTVAAGLATNSPISFMIPVTPTAAASGTTLSNTATVSGGGDPSCPAATHCASTVATPVDAPQLTIVKTASAPSFVVSVPASYTLQVTNTGTATTTSASTVTDNVAAGLTIGGLPAGCSASGQAVTCTIATGLATNSPVSFVIAVTPTAAASGTTLSNTATVSGGGDPTCPGATHCASTVTTPVDAPQLTIVKTASGASFVVGVPASYTVQVTNTGTAATTATSTVTDNVPGTLTIGTLPAGCSASGQAVTCTIAAGLATNSPVSFVIAVTPTAAASGTTLSNTATVSGGGDPTCPAATHCASTVTTPVDAPQLTIVKTASAASFVVGVPASYTVQVTNTGTAATTATSTVTDNVPGTLTIGTVPAGCSASGQAVTCTIAMGLAVNSPVSFVIPVTPTAAASGTTETNTATVSGGGDPTCPAAAHCASTVTTTVNTLADLSVIKSGPAQLVAGANATYTLTVTNNGPNTALAAQLADPTPSGLTFVSASTPCQSGFPCALGDLPNGASTIVSVTFAVAANASGTITNTASVSSPTADPNLANNTSTLTLAVVIAPTSADLSLIKTGPASVTAGGTVAYTIVVANHGPNAAMNVVVSDPTPAGLTFVANAGACATAYPCALGTLANGASMTITSMYAVPANYAGANPIVNTANVGSDTPDPNGSNNTGSATTPVVVTAPSADLSIVKTGPITATAGSSVTYTLLVANQGPDAVPDAMISDATPIGLSFVSASAPCASGFPCTLGALANGASVTLTVTYAIDASYIGPVVNTASVNSATVPDPTPNDNSSSVTTTVSGGPGTPVTPVPIDARWMLALIGLLLMLVGASLARRLR